MARRAYASVVKNVRRMVRICSLWLFAGCFAILASTLFASPAWGEFACVDVEPDGACTAGVDIDVTAEILDDGIFFTTGDLVIPAEVKSLSTKSENGFTLIAEGNMTIDADLLAQNGNARITLISQGGTISVRDAALNATQFVSLTAQGDVVIGPKASLQARERGLGMVNVRSEQGSVLLLEGSDAYAASSINMNADGGDLSVDPGSKLQTKKCQGRVTLSAAGDVIVDSSQICAELLRVLAKGNLVDFQDNLVKVPNDGGMVFLFAQSSTVNIDGTRFKNLDPSDLIIRTGN